MCLWNSIGSIVERRYIAYTTGLFLLVAKALGDRIQNGWYNLEETGVVVYKRTFIGNSVKLFSTQETWFTRRAAFLFYVRWTNRNDVRTRFATGLLGRAVNLRKNEAGFTYEYSKGTYNGHIFCNFTIRMCNVPTRSRNAPWRTGRREQTSSKYWFSFKISCGLTVLKPSPCLWLYTRTMLRGGQRV